MSKGRLQGKVAVVTGASKGIGAGIAKALGAEGASVVVNYAGDRKGAEKVAAEIVEHGGKAITVQGDVSKSADVKWIFDEGRKAFGKLDVLVNNAGVFKFFQLEETQEEEFHRQFNINVLGTLLSTREALNHFGPDGGSVINVSSVASQAKFPNASVYSATKGAVDAISRVLGTELGARKIRVNTLAPGGVETEGTHTAGIIGSDLEKQMVASTPLGRIGQPNDIAQVAVFLASDDSAWITGERIVVSGGAQ
jgi:3-oxoacyl-[acyl-carrier protein] reductase